MSLEIFYRTSFACVPLLTQLVHSFPSASLPDDLFSETATLLFIRLMPHVHQTIKRYMLSVNSCRQGHAFRCVAENSREKGALCTRRVGRAATYRAGCGARKAHRPAPLYDREHSAIRPTGTLPWIGLQLTLRVDTEVPRPLRRCIGWYRETLPLPQVPEKVQQEERHHE